MEEEEEEEGGSELGEGRGGHTCCCWEGVRITLVKREG